jgi:hypothetical protein
MRIELVLSLNSSSRERKYACVLLLIKNFNNNLIRVLEEISVSIKIDENIELQNYS